MTKNLKKFTAEKNCNWLIPRPPWRMSKQKEKLSTLKREHPALQNMKYLAFFYFSGSFWPSWIRIHWPDWIRIRIRNTDTDTCIIHVHRYITFCRYPKRGSKSGDLAASRIGFTAENKTNKKFPNFLLWRSFCVYMYFSHSLLLHVSVGGATRKRQVGGG